MNIILENKIEKISKNLVLLILISTMVFSLYTIISYKPIYYKSVEKTYFTEPVINPATGDTLSK
jgi:hypothetical protein